MSASTVSPLRNTAIVVPSRAGGVAGVVNSSMTWRRAASTSRTGSGLSPRSHRRSTWLWADTTDAAMSSARSAADSDWSPIQSVMKVRNNRW
jgi:hypothetical protein